MCNCILKFKLIMISLYRPVIPIHKAILFTVVIKYICCMKEDKKAEERKIRTKRNCQNVIYTNKCLFESIFSRICTFSFALVSAFYETARWPRFSSLFVHFVINGYWKSQTRKSNCRSEQLHSKSLHQTNYTNNHRHNSPKRALRFARTHCVLLVVDCDYDSDCLCGETTHRF